MMHTEQHNHDYVSLTESQKQKVLHMCNVEELMLLLKAQHLYSLSFKEKKQPVHFNWSSTIEFFLTFI